VLFSREWAHDKGLGQRQTVLSRRLKQGTSHILQWHRLRAPACRKKEVYAGYRAWMHSRTHTTSHSQNVILANDRRLKFKWKWELKVPLRKPWKHGGVEVYILSFSAPDGSEWQESPPSCIPPPPPPPTQPHTSPPTRGTATSTHWTESAIQPLFKVFKGTGAQAYHHQASSTQVFACLNIRVFVYGLLSDAVSNPDYKASGSTRLTE